MSDSRPPRQPRDWAMIPAEFGTTPVIGWKITDQEGVNPSRAMLAAAQVQHHISVYVRDQMKVRESRRTSGSLAWTARAVADRLTTADYDMLMRMLRGEAHLTLRTILDLSDQFGPLLTLAAPVALANELPHGWPDQLPRRHPGRQ